MKNEKFNFYFCGLDEKCALCNGHDCPGYGECHILKAEAERLLRKTGDPVIHLFKTKDADMMSAEEYMATKNSLPKELEIIHTFDFESEALEARIEAEMARIEIEQDAAMEAAWKAEFQC